jgi:hypothetical protein
LKNIQINRSRHCYTGPAHWSAPVPLQRASVMSPLSLALLPSSPPFLRFRTTGAPSAVLLSPTSGDTDELPLPPIRPFGFATTSVDCPHHFPVHFPPSQITGKLPCCRSCRHRVGHYRRPLAVSSQAPPPSHPWCGWSAPSPPVALAWLDHRLGLAGPVPRLARTREEARASGPGHAAWARSGRPMG